MPDIVSGSRYRPIQGRYGAVIEPKVALSFSRLLSCQVLYMIFDMARDDGTGAMRGTNLAWA
jgi:hypothetical protein